VLPKGIYRSKEKPDGYLGNKENIQWHCRILDNQEKSLIQKKWSYTNHFQENFTTFAMLMVYAAISYCPLKHCGGI
jgi:hypothetical protein